MQPVEYGSTIRMSCWEGLSSWVFDMVLRCCCFVVDKSCNFLASFLWFVYRLSLIYITVVVAYFKPDEEFTEPFCSYYRFIFYESSLVLFHE